MGKRLTPRERAILEAANREILGPPSYWEKLHLLVAGVMIFLLIAGGAAVVLLVWGGA